jgi:16S rRNA (cytosine1402-N4)-methyltransferase
VDRDQDALDFAKKRLQQYNNVIYVHSTFEQIEYALNEAGEKYLDSIFLDLGVSSFQIDEEKRGFAFRPEAPLDMRMDQRESLTAEKILAEYSEQELKRIFKEYGEERYSGRIARFIAKTRSEKKISRAADLTAIIDRFVKGQYRIKSYARIFQALRIEVNREMEILDETLDQAMSFLKPGGRIGILSYHSGEDRRIKNFLKKMENPCECPREFPVCVCGKKPQLKRIKPYLIIPSQEEIDRNSRARSAKFRAGEKL